MWRLALHFSEIVRNALLNEVHEAKFYIVMKKLKMVKATLEELNKIGFMRFKQ